MDGVRPEVEDSAEADSGDIPILVINVQMGQAIFEGAFMAATRPSVQQ